VVALSGVLDCLFLLARLGHLVLGDGKTGPQAPDGPENVIDTTL
jgi:hypothetical protein